MPSLLNGDYFEFLDVAVRGFKPYNGTFTQVPLVETVSLQELHLYGSSRLGIKTPYLAISKKQVKSAYASSYGNGLYLSYLDSRVIPLVNPAIGPFFEHGKGLKQYELANHLGNVLVVFEDKKVSHEGTSGVVGNYTASLLSVQDYYPFGWTMPGRGLNVPDYRFGFNGKENDREYGAGGFTQDYGFRMYNPAIGKFLSVDPLFQAFPFYTPYQFSANTPIAATDLDGKEAEIRIFSKWYIGEFECALQNGDAERVVVLVGAIIKDFAKDGYQAKEFVKNGSTGPNAPPASFNICEYENPFNYIDVFDGKGKYITTVYYNSSKGAVEVLDKDGGIVGSILSPPSEVNGAIKGGKGESGPSGGTFDFFEWLKWNIGWGRGADITPIIGGGDLGDGGVIPNPKIGPDDSPTPLKPQTVPVSGPMEAEPQKPDSSWFEVPVWRYNTHPYPPPTTRMEKRPTTDTTNPNIKRIPDFQPEIP